jgi:chorismate synthase
VRVAAGAIARKWLEQRYGIVIRGYMAQLGPVEIPSCRGTSDGNAFFAPNQAIVPQLEAYMDELRKSAIRWRAHQRGRHRRARRLGRAGL